jgi:Ca2+/H+ antiporter
MPDIDRTQPDKPNNHMVMAIVSTVLSVITCAFFWVIPIAGGIVSIVFASQVNSKYNAGDYEGAENSAKYAKIAWIVAIVTIVAYLIYLVVVVGASWDMIMEQFNAEMERQKELQGQ